MMLDTGNWKIFSDFRLPATGRYPLPLNSFNGLKTMRIILAFASGFLAKVNFFVPSVETDGKG